MYVDGFIVGNIPSGNGETLVRNDDGIPNAPPPITTYEDSQRSTSINASSETPKRPDFSSWEWMDKEKKQQLASMESLIITSPEEEKTEYIESSENHGHENDHNHNAYDDGQHDDHHQHAENHHADHHPDHHHADHGVHMHHGAEHMDHHGAHHHDHHTPHFEGQVSAIFNPLPDDYQGLESSTQHLSRSERSFVDINNELGFKIYKLLLEKEEYKSKNLIFSPLSTSTMLAMVFLGARGTTSWQMNTLLKLDEMISFNPHLMYKNED